MYFLWFIGVDQEGCATNRHTRRPSDPPLQELWTKIHAEESEDGNSERKQHAQEH